MAPVINWDDLNHPALGMKFTQGDPVYDYWFGGGRQADAKSKKDEATSISRLQAADTRQKGAQFATGQGVAANQGGQMYDAWTKAQQAAKAGLAPDPGNFQSFIQAGGGGTNKNPNDPNVRAAFFQAVYGPWMQQQMGMQNAAMNQTGQQMQDYLKSTGANVSPQYAGLFNAGAKQMNADVGQVAGAGNMLSMIMSNPQTQNIASQLQQNTSAQQKAFMEQRMALTNALSGGAGGGLQGIMGAAPAAQTLPGASPGLPQVPAWAQPKQ